MQVIGMGNLKFHINDITQVISKLYYLPGLKNSLLSVGKLMQKDLTIVFHGEKGVIMTIINSSNMMFVVSRLVILPLCMNVTTDNVT